MKRKESIKEEGGKEIRGSRKKGEKKMIEHSKTKLVIGLESNI